MGLSNRRREDHVRYHNDMPVHVGQDTGLLNTDRMLHIVSCQRLQAARNAGARADWADQGAHPHPRPRVTDGAGGLLFVVEQDGRIHESTDLITRDRLRNGHYAKAGIPCIVLNSSEIRSSQMCMAKSLDWKLERLGMRKPAGLPASTDILSDT